MKRTFTITNPKSRGTLAVGLMAVGTLAFSSSASAQISITTATTAFTNISATGTSLGAAIDDSEFNITSAALSSAGFAGNELLPLANVRVGNNGAVLWNNTASEVGYINSTTFATMVASNLTTTGNGGSTAGTSFLCVLWDDHVPTAGLGSSTLHWQVIGGNLILQWSNEDHYGITGTGSTQFQAIIYGGATIGSGAPLVDFVYNDTLYGASG